ncbi:uncharacterized protein LOC142591418 [Dermacentor variabilis]|uniref:uncharacterized protein LOC142591418 n=1 Tax=Dermacentor variabilis TaxID=34621 RepID=UPI003F5C4575
MQYRRNTANAAASDPALADAATDASTSDQPSSSDPSTAPTEEAAVPDTETSADAGSAADAGTTEADSAADDGSASEPAESIPQAAPTGDSTTNMTTGGSETSPDSNDNCIEVTIPNILGIEKCLKDNLNLCTGENTLIEGVLLLVNCTVFGVFENLTPMNALKSVRDILVAILKKVLPPAATILEKMPMLSFGNDIEDNACRGPIKIGFPSSLGKCMDNTLKFCENGETVDMSIITSLLSTLGCTLETLLTTTPDKLIRTLLCDIARALGALFGNSFGTQQFIQMLAEATCPAS